MEADYSRHGCTPCPISPHSFAAIQGNRTEAKGTDRVAATQEIYLLYFK